MTAVAQRRPAQAPPPAPDRRAAALHAGWLPPVAVLAASAAVLAYHGVAARDTAAFAAYSLLGVTLPGTLLWRAVRGGAGRLPVDAALGTVAGLAVELPAYLVARQAGVPAAVAAWPVAVLVVFAAVPRLRRYWRGDGRRLPVGVSWAAAAAVLFTLASTAVSTFRWNALAGPAAATGSPDFPFQVALVGLLRHPLPLDTPWVAGTDLQYHWYVYAHAAAASWLTGVEAQVLVLRLLPLPLVAAFVLILLGLVHRITGRWWPGALALLLMLLGPAVSPFAWHDRPTFTGLIVDTLWVSPTQTLGALCCAAALYLLCGLLRPGGARRRARWAAFAVATGVTAGAKATFLPMLVCGLLLAAAVRALPAARARTGLPAARARTGLPAARARTGPPARRRTGPELPALAVTLAWLAFAQLVLYGAGSQGTELRPWQTVKWTPLGRAVLGRPDAADGGLPVLVLTGAAVLATAFGWAGAVGLLRRRWRRDPAVLVLAGFAASGVGALYAVAHPGLSQTYFARSAGPYLAVLSAVGLAALLPAGERVPRRLAVLAAGGALAGAAVLVAVRATAGHDAPRPRSGGWTLREAVLPYLLVAGALAVVAVLMAVVARGWRLGRRHTAAALAVTVLATAVASGLLGARPLWAAATAGTPQRELAAPGAPRALPRGAVAAARWLRAHSRPGDRVATNSHCRAQVSPCDSRDFWLAAYAERPVVLQGWSYTEPAFASGRLFGGTLARSRFWDPALLAANDAVFTRPGPVRVAAFAAAYRVRWLVAVAVVPVPDPARTGQLRASPALARYATPRFTSGDVTVYEVTGSTAAGTR